MKFIANIAHFLINEFPNNNIFADFENIIFTNLRSRHQKNIKSYIKIKIFMNVSSFNL